MTETPDFEALRARRNERVIEHMRELAVSMGASPDAPLMCSFDPNSCYCDCATGGVCEHKWDGEGWTSADGCGWSATCSRCGTTAMSHDMRNLP